MIKILVVEDEPEKCRLLVETILSVSNIARDQIHIATDARAAKKRIKDIRYELVILDINIPPTAEKQTEVGGGLDVASFIKNNLTAKQPAFLVGMSAYDDGMVAATDIFSSPLWKLVRFSYTDMSWQEPLKGAVQYLVDHDVPPYISDGHSYHTDLAIFVALDEELDSIRALPANWIERNIPGDCSRYFEGQFSNSKGNINVVAVVAPKMGMPAAAATATKLIQSYRPKYIAITGICAGVRSKVKLGDILVADPCFDWGSGKWTKLKTGEHRFRPAPYPWRLAPVLNTALKKLGESKEFLAQIYNAYEAKKPSNPPEVFVEAMASGGSVLQASKLVDDVRDQHKNLVGIEMESYAVFTAAEYANEPRPQCFSIKAVCDFGDEKKSNHVHDYAAYISAQFLYKFSLDHFIEVDE